MHAISRGLPLALLQLSWPSNASERICAMPGRFRWVTSAHALLLTPPYPLIAQVDFVLCAQGPESGRLGPNAQGSHHRPRVLIEQGSLGADAAAAAAAGAHVTCCEPNRFAAAALRAVAERHGVSHAVDVVERSIEDVLRIDHDDGGGGDRYRWDVIVLTPLLEEAVLGKRLRPAAAAAAAVAPSALVVPHRVTVRVALARLSAGTIHGIDLTPLDAMRWAPYPMPMAAEREEGGTLLTRFVAAFCFDLHGAARGKTAGAAATAATAPTRECEVVFDLTAGALAGPSATGAATVRCNGLVLDVEPTFFGADDAAPTFGAEGGDGTGGAGGASSSIAAPQKRAVIFFPPLNSRLANGAGSHPPRRHVSAWSRAARAARRVGARLARHWRFAMLADAPRNDAYAAAIERAVARLHRHTPSSSAAAAPQKVRRERKGTTAGAAATGAAAPTLRGVDLGSGSGLLSLMLARALVAAEGRPPDVAVLGVESVPGVAQLSEVCIAQTAAHGWCPSRRRRATRSARASRRFRRRSARGAAPVAELMDSGGLGEGLLPLAHHAVASGLAACDAQLIPCRLRVWATVELHACGTALDAASWCRRPATASTSGMARVPHHAELREHRPRIGRLHAAHRGGALRRDAGAAAGQRDAAAARRHARRRERGRVALGG